MPRVDFGTAELTSDQYRPGAWLLRLDGVAQSYVDTIEPEHLEFGYMRLVAAVLDTVAPAGRPLRLLHLGGGAYTLPRYVAATRPGSAQTVVERDAALVALIARELPLPAGAGIEIEIADARSAVTAADPAAYDVVIGDVYEGAVMSGSAATVEFVSAVATLLAPGGTYIVNVTDLPPLAFSRRQVATVRSVLPDVCALAEPGLLRARRYGNLVIAGRRPPGELPVPRIDRRAKRTVAQAAVLHGDDLAAFVAGAGPLTDADAHTGGQVR